MVSEKTNEINGHADLKSQRDRFFKNLAARIPEGSDGRIGFRNKPNPGVGGFAMWPWSESRDLSKADEENLYTCIAACGRVKKEKGEKEWYEVDLKDGFKALLMVHFDDVGTGATSGANKAVHADKEQATTIETLRTALGTPTFVLETSPDNFQVGYLLENPCTDEEFAAGAMKAIVGHFAARGTVDELTSPVRIVRAPCSRNLKRKAIKDADGKHKRDDETNALLWGDLLYPGADGEGFRVRLIEENWSALHTLEGLAARIGVEINPLKIEKRSFNGSRSGNDYDDEAFRRVLEAMKANGDCYESDTDDYRGACLVCGAADCFRVSGPRSRQHYKYTAKCYHSGGSCSLGSKDDGTGGWSTLLRESGIEEQMDEDAQKAAQWACDKVEQLKAAAEYEERMQWELPEDSSNRRYHIDRSRAAPEPEHSPNEAESASESKSGEEVSEKASRGAGDAAGAAARKTQWSEGWYYLAARDRVARPGELTTYSKQGFDALFACEGGVEGGKAFDFVRKKIRFKHADGMAYVAGREPVFTFQGQTLVNEFIPSSIPKTAASYSDEGLAAVETIRYHLTLLTGEYKKPRAEHVYTPMLESWIALNIRAPGKIIGIAPLIKGIQGDGKTVIFKKMMEALLGAQNVKEASTKEVCSDYNAYAYGAAVRVIEELKMAGENRFAVADGVKPLITNEAVRVVAKRANGIDLPNATNYVALTNHADAVPIDDSDRRWLIIFTPWGHISDLEAVVGSIREYFTRLHKAIEEHAGALRKYFEECKIHQDFFHGMRAPITEWRGEVIAQEEALIGGDFFDAYVTSGEEHGISREILTTDLLTKAFERDMPRGSAPKTRQLSRLLKARGWHRVPGVVKLAGKTRVVYVSDERIADARMSEGVELRNAKLRKMFEATVPADYEKNRASYEEAGGGF
ncbi:hypothetical protein EVC45_02460 [Paraburkholderia sp. UYCP14C]|uniref:primase-helicase family protein n=1 Tax=Paraburkholderia sp. UYCP14C TaxID=2511130 RepID=UPI001021BDA3|nr:primase-helicase family protein [Paraburkholderia sp. UYCP14C]RZF31335.1 hypothetical protein EVC45_02460 [Paraburkholderia sp. UYCP14C]